MVRRSLNRRNGGKRRRSMRGGMIQGTPLDQKNLQQRMAEFKKQTSANANATASAAAARKSTMRKGNTKQDRINDIRKSKLRPVINGPDNVYICCFLDENIIEVLKERLKPNFDLTQKGHVFINVNTYNITEYGEDGKWTVYEEIPDDQPDKKAPHATLFTQLEMKRNSDEKKMWTKTLKDAVKTEWDIELQDVEIAKQKLMEKKIILINPAGTHPKEMADLANKMFPLLGFDSDVFDGEWPIEQTFTIGSNVLDTLSKQKWTYSPDNKETIEKAIDDDARVLADKETDEKKKAKVEITKKRTKLLFANKHKELCMNILRMVYHPQTGMVNATVTTEMQSKWDELQKQIIDAVAETDIASEFPLSGRAQKKYPHVFKKGFKLYNDLLGIIYTSLYDEIHTGATDPEILYDYLNVKFQQVTTMTEMNQLLNSSSIKTIPNIILDCEEDDLGAMLYGIKFAGTQNILIQRGSNDDYIDKASLIEPKLYYEDPVSKEYAKYNNIISVWEKIAELFAKQMNKVPPTVDNYSVGLEKHDLDNGKAVFKVIAQNVHKIIARIPDKTPSLDDIAMEIINGTRMAATPEVDVKVNPPLLGGKRRRTRRRKGRRSKKGVARKAQKKTRRRRRRGKKSKKH